MKRPFSKGIFWFFLGSGVYFAMLAALWRLTGRAIDIYINDRYYVISPGTLLLVSISFLAASLAIWKIRTII